MDFIKKSTLSRRNIVLIPIIFLYVYLRIDSTLYKKCICDQVNVATRKAGVTTKNNVTSLVKSTNRNRGHRSFTSDKMSDNDIRFRVGHVR